MAMTEVYTCDVCKQSKSKGDLAKITVRSEGIRMKDVGYKGICIDICPDCLMRKGFIVEFPQNDKEASDVAANKNAKTLEDKIFEILDDLGVAFVE